LDSEPIKVLVLTFPLSFSLEFAHVWPPHYKVYLQQQVLPRSASFQTAFWPM